MNFNPYQNYGAGLAALGPVQSMSDRNEAQTLMANSGQMFASGGIARLAEGGALPKYKYDPVSQTYVLSDDSSSKTAMDETLRKQTVGSSYDAPDAKGVTQQQAAVFDFMNTEKGASYKDAFGRANNNMITGFVNPFMGQNPLAAFRDASNVYSEAERAARADRIGNLPSGYEGVGGPGTYGNQGGIPGIGVGSREGLNSYDVMSMSDSPAGGFTGADPGGMFGGAQSGDVGFAYGGLAALARGGMSHLGDYSDGGRLLRGPGDGVSDSIPATIGNKRPARLADGEFVVPARIVSELGNGSTEAGARKLYAMMDRIQQARNKTVGKNRVAVNSRADKNLPA
jgi:hypothetical protein